MKVERVYLKSSKRMKRDRVASLLRIDEGQRKQSLSHFISTIYVVKSNKARWSTDQNLCRHRQMHLHDYPTETQAVTGYEHKNFMSISKIKLLVKMN